MLTFSLSFLLSELFKSCVFHLHNPIISIELHFTNGAETGQRRGRDGAETGQRRGRDGAETGQRRGRDGACPPGSPYSAPLAAVITSSNYSSKDIFLTIKIIMITLSHSNFPLYQMAYLSCLKSSNPTAPLGCHCT